MPIRFFEHWGQSACSKQYLYTSLNDKTLAIDGFWYFKKYLAPYDEASFDDYTTNITQALKKVVDLAKISNIHILWVWDGIEVKTASMNSFSQEVIARKTLQGLEGDKKKFFKNFFDPENFVEFTTKFLRDHGITVVRAPYSASAQLVYFAKQKVIDAFFGKVDALLFKDCDIVISELSDEMYTEIDRSQLLLHNKLDLEAFRRLAFTIGCEYCSTHPFYASGFDFRDCVEMIKQNIQISATMQIIDAAGIYCKFREEYYRAFIICDFQPIMSVDGVVRCIDDSKDVPCDLDVVFGRRLSDNLYHQLFTCSIGTKMLNQYLFKKETCLYKEAIAKQFDDLLNLSPIDVSKSFDVVTFLSKHLDVNVTLSSDIPPFIQFVFMCLKEYNFVKFELADLLICTSPELVEKTTTKYTMERLLSYLKLSEAILFFRDLFSYIKNTFRLQGDIVSPLLFKDLSKNGNLKEIEKFLQQNIKNHSEVQEILQIIKNK